MNDLLLRLFSFSIVATGAQAQQPGQFLGRNRSYNAVARAGGDWTGAGVALSFTLEESNALASGYAQIPGTGTINVTEQSGSYSTNPAKVELPRAGNPLRVPFSTTKDYVRAVVLAGGTTPAIPGVSIYAEPLDVATKPSGS